MKKDLSYVSTDDIEHTREEPANSNERKKSCFYAYTGGNGCGHPDACYGPSCEGCVWYASKCNYVTL
jgi:hypothetical protein